MKKATNIVFCLIMSLMLLIPLFMTNTEEGAVCDVDGREYVAMPAFGSAGFTSGAEQWLRDRLGLRDKMVDAYAVSNDRLFDELINTTYQYGKDGYTFFKIHSNIEYSDYHKSFAKMVYDMQQYCESRGTRFYYVFNPEKESVYERYLPAGVNYSDAWADSMLAEMDDLGVNYIDLRDKLTELSYEEDVFNRKYDAGHWNAEGAFQGTRILTEHIHKDIPEVSVLEKSEYEISEAIAEKLYGSNQIFNEEIPKYTLKADYRDTTAEAGSELKKSTDHPYFQIVRNDSEKASGIERLLLFEDVMYEPFAFARAKETIALSCLQNAVNFDYFYNIYKPDLVVFENMEYVVNDTFFSQTAIETSQHNPSVIENFPEEDFSDRRDALLSNAKNFDTKAEVVVIPGKSVDKIFISSNIDEGKYYYLITDNRAIDIKADENGALTADVRHGDLTSPGEAALYYLDDAGEGHYALVPVSDKLSNVAAQSGNTNGAIYDSGSDSWKLTTDNSNNYFSCSVIQLIDRENNNDISNISNNFYSTGKVKGAYCHKLKTGTYSVVVKGNSNLMDEYVEYKVRLKKGRTYWYTYTVDELSEKQIVFRDFAFYESSR